MYASRSALSVPGRSPSVRQSAGRVTERFVPPFELDAVNVIKPSNGGHGAEPNVFHLEYVATHISLPYANRSVAASRSGVILILRAGDIEGQQPRAYSAYRRFCILVAPRQTQPYSS